MSARLSRAYVGVMHGLGRTPLFPSLDDPPPPRLAGNLRHWWASLPAIHDLDRMIALDVPWWTYRAIDAVSAFLEKRPGARVFEWGSGASTVWLSKRSGSVISIEHDGKWHAFLEPKIGPLANVETRLILPALPTAQQPATLSRKPGWADLDFTDYASAIGNTAGTFDLIVIDGRVRGACLEQAAGALSDGGVIVFDNSHRARYRRAIYQSGLEQARLRGLTPSLPYPDETTLLTRRR
jgi:hypothetical protein